MITNKLDFSLIEVNTAKEKIMETTAKNTGSSIKGFFSQFTVTKEKDP